LRCVARSRMRCSSIDGVVLSPKSSCPARSEAFVPMFGTEYAYLE
jgi:hypothetical protein